MSEAQDAAPPRPRTSAWVRGLQLAVTLACIGLLLAFVDLGEVAALLGHADPLLLAAALGVAILDRALMIAKWYPLLAVQAPAISFGEAARSYLVANLTNYFLPSTVGSDALRAAALGRRHGRILEVGASIAAERLWGLLANGVLVTLSLAVALRMAVPVGDATRLALAILVGVGLAALLVFWGRFRGLLESLLPERLLGRHEARLRRFVGAYVGYKRHPAMLTGVAVLTLIEVCFPMAIVWIVGLALHAPLGFATLLVAVPISSLVAKVPVSIAGLGPQEATLVSLLDLLGVAPETGFALAAVTRGLDVAISLPGAFLWPEWMRGLAGRA
jgi:uncharacterized protein (TIRG00374 family)